MKKISAFLAAALFPATAFAHTGIGDASGFVHGFMHPAGGLDHVLAMVCVGFFAYVLGGRALWLVPAAFVTMMAAGGFLGISGFALPYVELGIALSIIVIGMLAAVGPKMPVAAAMALAGGFAVFHGFAHGAEMPQDASGLTYGIGFMLATALLHAAGIAACFAVAKLATGRGLTIARLGGGIAALAGVGVVSGAL
jgi:urease accessory protein